MNTIPTPIVNKLVEVITTISSQSKDNPDLVKSIFGFSIVKACNEISAELETKKTDNEQINENKR